MDIRTYGKICIRRVDPQLYHRAATDISVVNLFDQMLKEFRQTGAFSSFSQHQEPGGYSSNTSSEGSSSTMKNAEDITDTTVVKHRVSPDVDSQCLQFSQLSLSPITSTVDLNLTTTTSSIGTVGTNLDLLSFSSLEASKKAKETVAPLGSSSTVRQQTISQKFSKRLRLMSTTTICIDNMILSFEESSLPSVKGLAEGRLPSLQDSLKLLCSSFSVDLPLEFATDSAGEDRLTYEEAAVLALCRQHKVIPFLEAFPPPVLSACKKIGEGTYGEVFLYCSEDEGENVMKIIPIQGDIEVNGVRQKTYESIFPEVMVSKVLCIYGEYPEELCIKWHLYALEEGTENDSPDVFPPTQKFLVFIFANGGMDLDKFKVGTFAKALSIFKQVAISVAIAEVQLEFEHRDLHVGNILVQTCNRSTVIHYLLDSIEICVKTDGVFVSIADYSLSRLKKGQCCLFYDMQREDTIFNGPNEPQFNVYRMMRENNKNDWKRYSPKTNIMWLHYLLEYLLQEANIHNTSKKGKQAKEELKTWKAKILQFESSCDFVISEIAPR